MKKVIAIDLGATSGRLMLGTYEGKKLDLSEIHRFSNDPVTVFDGLYWDILRLFHEIKTGLKKAVLEHKIDSISIDTWGVDFGLIDKDGRLLDNPYHYRHIHTQNLAGKLPQKRLYELSGLAANDFNTLCQLIALKKANSTALKNADNLLFIPDLLAYFLTGEKVTEYTIASTSQMLTAGKLTWDKEILSTFDIDENLFCHTVMPSEIIGNLSNEIKGELNIDYDIKVTACCGHDTASAVMAAKVNPNTCYISSGTWSLIGLELQKPILSEKARLAGYTNEGGFGGNIRFLKNITGLWIINECMRNWQSRGEGLSFKELDEQTELAKADKCIIDVNDKRFFTPLNMPEKIQEYCKETGQEIPVTKGEIARCIYESLAHEYKKSVLELEEITGESIHTINIVGGGSKNYLLNKFTEEKTGRKVIAGPAEATAIGNILCQLIALKELEGLSQAREVLS